MTREEREDPVLASLEADHSREGVIVIDAYNGEIRYSVGGIRVATHSFGFNNFSAYQPLIIQYKSFLNNKKVKYDFEEKVDLLSRKTFHIKINAPDV